MSQVADNIFRPINSLELPDIEVLPGVGGWCNFQNFGFCTTPTADRCVFKVVECRELTTDDFGDLAPASLGNRGSLSVIDGADRRGASGRTPFPLAAV
jgi:hypothetical protein